MAVCLYRYDVELTRIFIHHTYCTRALLYLIPRFYPISIGHFLKASPIFSSPSLRLLLSSSRTIVDLKQNYLTTTVEQTQIYNKTTVEQLQNNFMTTVEQLKKSHPTSNTISTTHLINQVNQLHNHRDNHISISA